MAYETRANYLRAPALRRAGGSVRVQLTQRLSDGEGDSSVVRHGEMADAAYSDVLHIEIRMIQPTVATGHDQVVDIAVERDKPGVALWRRLAQLLDYQGVRRELTYQGQQRGDPGQLSALVRRTERYQCVYESIAAQSLHVIARNEAAKAVSDDMDTFVTGGRGQLFDGFAQPRSGPWNVVGQQAVVVRGERLEPAAPKRVLHHRKDCVVVDDSVHEHDRRLGCVYPIMEQSTLFGAEAAQIMTAPGSDGPSGRGEQSERIHHQMSGGPGGFDGESRRHPRHVQRHKPRQRRG